MTLSRSVSPKSTLSTIQRRATRYEKYITLSSVFLIITSTIVIFTSAVLIKWYFVPNLDFWHPSFSIAPYLMFSMGVYKFLVSIYGFIIAEQKNRGLLVVFAVLLVIAFVGQLTSVYYFSDLKTRIQNPITPNEISNVLNRYGEDRRTTESWDQMQEHLSCCGGMGWVNGYQSYQHTSIGSINNSVPDSCCRMKRKGCGIGIFNRRTFNCGIPDAIFLTGCIEILRKWMENDVMEMIDVYTAVGIAIAFVELIAVVLTSAYVAQITRRLQGEQLMWYSVNSASGNAKENSSKYDSFQRRPPTVDLSSLNDTEV